MTAADVWSSGYQPRHLARRPSLVERAERAIEWVWWVTGCEVTRLASYWVTAAALMGICQRKGWVG